MTPRSRADSPTLIVVDWSRMSIMLIWLNCWLDSSHRTSVFVGFSFSLLGDIQSLMALTHAVNLWTASAPHWPWYWYIWLSSANWWKRRPCWVITWLDSAVYTERTTAAPTRNLVERRMRAVEQLTLDRCSCFAKIFNTRSKDVTNDCQLYFHFDAISDVITERKQKFLNNYQSSENLLCSVVCSTW